jgi:integrase
MMTSKQKIQKANHPKPGSQTKVEPIRNTKDIQTIKKTLAAKPMDAAFFAIGINTNLRASDILNIKVEQVRGAKPGDEIEVREKKTGKVRRLTLNKNVVAAVKNLLASKAYEPGDYLFKGQRGVWSVPYVSQKVKGWCKTVNLKGNYGSHSLRKTWGYHQRVTFGQSLPVLMECFNHSTQKQTLDYLCIQDEEVKSVYMNEL